MKKLIKSIIFQIGVDCLGFPKFHKHNFYEVKKPYKTIFHNKYHNSIKYN